MSVPGDVRDGYRTALGFLGPFTLTHLGVRLLTAAVVVPATGLVLAAALAVSGQSAITDQDIARFVMTPAGFAFALVLIALSIMAAILDVAAMTATLRRHERRAIGAFLSGLGLLVSRFTFLFRFGLTLVLRVFVIAAPFLLTGVAVAWLALGRYDINYYLTHRPPAFLAAAGIGALLVAGLAAILVRRLAGWAIALHLVVLAGQSPRQAFAESARKLHGRRTGVVARIVLWLLVRIGLATVVTLVAGLLIAGAHYLFGPDLRLIALSTIAVFVLWWLANAVLAALANGALAVLLDGLYREVAGDASTAALPVAAPGSRDGRRARLVVIGAAAAVLVGSALGGGLVGRVVAVSP